MCGRVRLSSDVSEIKLVFGIPPDRPIPNFPPSWNAAPTDSLPVVRFDSKAGQRSLDMLSCCVGYVHHKEVPNFDSSQYREWPFKGVKAPVEWQAGTIYDCPNPPKVTTLSPKSPGIGRISVEDAYFWNAPC